MPLADGCHHIALVTDDLDRFLDFWTGVFDGDVLLDMTEDGIRHAMVDIGAGFCLHPFTFADDSPHGRVEGDIFSRGHLDHVAIRVDDEGAFTELRRRLVDAGATDGELVDFGLVRTVSFHDPDGMACEIAMWADAPARPLAEVTREPMTV